MEKVYRVGNLNFKYFFLNSARNKIEYIREEKFKAFIAEKTWNSLSFLMSSSMNCSHIQPFLWFLCDRDRYIARIGNSKCSNGTELWDLDIDRSECPITTSGGTTECPITSDITTERPKPPVSTNSGHKFLYAIHTIISSLTFIWIDLKLKI